MDPPTKQHVVVFIAYLDGTEKAFGYICTFTMLEIAKQFGNGGQNVRAYCLGLSVFSCILCVRLLFVQLGGFQIKDAQRINYFN